MYHWGHWRTSLCTLLNTPTTDITPPTSRPHRSTKQLLSLYNSPLTGNSPTPSKAPSSWTRDSDSKTELTEGMEPDKELQTKGGGKAIDREA